MVDDARLALVWDENARFRRTRIPSPRPFLFIENRGTATWEDDQGEYWAFVSVFEAVTGERMPSHGVAIGGVGRTYRLLPGERVSIPATFMTDLTGLAAGTYELEARIPELGLRSERWRLDLAPDQQDSP